MKRAALFLGVFALACVGSAQNYLLRGGTLYQDFEDTSAWKAPVGSASADTAHVQNGARSLLVSEGSGYSGHAYKPINTSFASTGTISFWVYTQYPVNDNGWHACSLYLTGDSFQNYFLATSQKLRPGWSKVVFSKNDFQANGTPSWNTPMTTMQVGVFSDTADGMSCSFDNMSVSEMSRPKVMISFDDDYVSSYSSGYTYMKKYGFVGSEYVISSTVNASGRTSAAQLQEMYSYGWDMCNHTTTHPDLRTLTQAQVQAEFQTCQQYLIGQGWTRNSGYLHLAYPQGHFNQTVLNADAAVGLLSARTTMETQQADQLDSKYLLYSMVPDSTSQNVNDIIASVDQAVNNGTALILTFHNLTNTPQVAIDWKITDFQAIVDHIALLKAQGKLDVITVPQWYAGLQPQQQSSVNLSGIKTNALSNAAGIDNTGFAYFSAPLPAASNITVSVSPAVVQVPTTVTAPAGATSVTFPITSSWVNTSTVVTLTITYNSKSLSCTFTVVPKAPNQLLLDATSVKSGGSVLGHVWLNAPAPAGGATVTLSTDNALGSVPTQVVIPEGWFHMDFTVTTKKATAASTVIHVSATYDGTTLATPLTVTK
jgi:peptidoglycan/xylan/chitin deacetylase (PgdA/CDA1 family)